MRMDNPDFPTGPDPDDLEVLERVPLEPYQSLWLEIQIRELGVKKAVVIWEALREWVSRYPNLEFPPGTPPNVVAKALEEFMARHREEFLPLKG
jgi:hypothetical protein